MAWHRYPKEFMELNSTGSFWGAHDGSCLSSMNPRFKPEAGERCAHRFGSGPGGVEGTSDASGFASATKLEATYVGESQDPDSTIYPALFNCGYNYGVNKCPSLNSAEVAAQNLAASVNSGQEPQSAVAMATLPSTLFDFGMLASRAGCLAIFHPAGTNMAAENLQVAIKAVNSALPTATAVVKSLASVNKAAAEKGWVQTLHGAGGCLAQLNMGADLQSPPKESGVYAGPLLQDGIAVGAKVRLKGGSEIEGLKQGVSYTVTQGPGSFNHIKVKLASGKGSSWIKASKVVLTDK